MRIFCKHTSVCILLMMLLTFIPIAESKGQQVIAVRASDANAVRYYENNQDATILLRGILRQHIEDGYPFATFDTLQGTSDTVALKPHLGTKVKWRFPEDWKSLTFQQQLTGLINNGYPFAAIAFDSLQLEGEEIKVTPRIIEGPKIIFDTLSLSGTDKLSVRYLHALLGFKPGEVYDERKYTAISRRLSSQSLVQLSAPPDIGFSNGKAIVYLQAKATRSDRAEGVLGFLPDASGGSVITGYLKLDLNNLFQSGKSFYLDWNRFSQDAQRLDLRFGYPFLLGSRVSVGADLFILRQDSLFTQRKFGIDLQVPISSTARLGLRLQSAASDIQAMEPTVENGLDFRLTEYRPFIEIGHVREVLAYGDQFGVKFSTGLSDKRFRKNPLFPESVYDTIRFRTTNVQVDFMAQMQRTLFQRSAIYTKLVLGVLEGDQIVRNEFYRIGGLNSFRGFNENNFFASGFLKWQTEFRQYFAKSSYMMAFYDVSLLDQNNSRFQRSILLHAFGGGMALDTSNGNFRLIFAMGSSENTTLDIRSTKIHFGYSISF